MSNLIASLGLDVFWFSWMIFAVLYLSIWISYEVYSLYRKKRTCSWSYKDYKKFHYVIDYQGKDLLTKLAEKNLDSSQIKNLIDSFNSLDPDLKYPLTVEMVDFEKGLLEESKPAKILSDKKWDFVRAVN